MVVLAFAKGLLWPMLRVRNVGTMTRSGFSPRSTPRALWLSTVITSWVTGASNSPASSTAEIPTGGESCAVALFLSWNQRVTPSPNAEIADVKFGTAANVDVGVRTNELVAVRSDVILELEDDEVAVREFSDEIAIDVKEADAPDKLDETLDALASMLNVAVVDAETLCDVLKSFWKMYAVVKISVPLLCIQYADLPNSPSGLEYIVSVSLS
jgi:hypothetical protein